MNRFHVLQKAFNNYGSVREKEKERKRDRGAFKKVFPSSFGVSLKMGVLWVRLRFKANRDNPIFFGSGLNVQPPTGVCVCVGWG